MTDLGDFEVQSDALREAAKGWLEYESAARLAHELVARGKGMGSKFGFLANLTEESPAALHDQFIDDRCDDLVEACMTFQYLAAALTSTANAYDGVDETRALSFEKLNRLLPDA